MNQTRPTPKFAIALAFLLPLALLAAAALLYYSTVNARSAAGAAASELAALSNSIPLHASAAADGNLRAIDSLGAGLERLEALVASETLPGSPALWERLQRDGALVRGARDTLASVQQANASAAERLPEVVAGAGEILDAAGAPQIRQRFDAAAGDVRRSLTAMAAGGDVSAAAATASAGLDDMQRILSALGGGDEPDIDVAAVEDSARAAQLSAVDDLYAEFARDANAALAGAATLTEIRESARALYRTADSLFASVTAGAAVAGAAGAGLISRELWQVLGLVGLAFLASLIVGQAFLRSARIAGGASHQASQNERNQQAILRLLDELGSLADGDLTVQATVTEDITGAIADSINYAIEALRDLVATINDTSIMVDSAAKQTEAAAQHMSSSSRRQAKEVEATTSALSSIIASIEEVAGNAERSSDVARHSVDVAHKGGEAVRRTIDGMNTIRETIQETSKRIKRLGESSQEIGNIVELINDIAEQTNILALNASIQASMAGEAGRGFAVVADEVQRLAERSTNATKQIEVLVRTIQTDTNEAVVSMERSTTDVVGGALLAENAGAALDEIEQVSNQIASLVQNISESSREQGRVAHDIDNRTTNLKAISDKSGRETAATAAAIRKLSELASQLRQTVAGFQLPDFAAESGAYATADDVAGHGPGVDDSQSTQSAAARQAL